MRRRSSWRVGFALVAALVGNPLRSSESDPPAILRSMGEAARHIQDYTAVLLKQERRVEGLEPEQTLLVKWARPFQIYFKSLDGPSRGQEVLFVQGRNRNRLRAHKGSFPDLTLSLDPRGSWAMGHTHHPVTEASLVHLVELVLHDFDEAERRHEGSVRSGEESFLGRSCLKIEATFPPDGENYVVRKGETLWDVAAKAGRDMYAVLYHNREKGWTRPRDPDPGDRLFVPRYYAGRLLLYVDRESQLPLVVLIYAHDGRLYERYEHRDLKVNVGLTDRDFDPANPTYDF